MTRAEIKAVAADDYASWKQHTGGETKHGVESRAAVGQRGADAVRALVTDSAYSDSTPTTLKMCIRDRITGTTGQNRPVDGRRVCDRCVAGARPGRGIAKQVRTCLLYTSRCV